MRKFHWRSFASLGLTLAGLVLLLSGLVLYVAPPGRVAHWSRWTLGGLDKERWQAVHTVFALLFVAGSVLHVVVNWRVLKLYLAGTGRAGSRRAPELAAATAVFLVALGGTLAGVPPFESLMALGEAAREAWVARGAEPPVAHAEAMPLPALAEAAKVPLEQGVENLRAAGVRVEGHETTLARLARQTGRTPQQLFVVFRGSQAGAPAARPASGGGYGRRTVSDVCAELGITVDEGLARLREAGVEASPVTALRDLVDPQGRSPHELLEVLRGPAS